MPYCTSVATLLSAVSKASVLAKPVAQETTISDVDQYVRCTCSGSFPMTVLASLGSSKGKGAAGSRYSGFHGLLWAQQAIRAALGAAACQSVLLVKAGIALAIA